MPEGAAAAPAAAVGDLPPEEVRRLGHRAIDWIADYLADVGDLPVFSDVRPVGRLARIRRVLSNGVLKFFFVILFCFRRSVRQKLVQELAIRTGPPSVAPARNDDVSAVSRI